MDYQTLQFIILVIIFEMIIIESFNTQSFEIEMIFSNHDKFIDMNDLSASIRGTPKRNAKSKGFTAGFIVGFPFDCPSFI